MNTCNVYLLKNFPITDYANVYYKNADSSQDTIDLFLNYCEKIENKDKFTNLSSIDFTQGFFKVSIEYKIANEYNYCLIKDNEENKWYCCFINSVTWNSNLTICTFNFEIDVFHTYIKQVDFQKCFVEREHVQNDSFGLHILDEGIGVREYIAISSNSFGNISYRPCLAISDTTMFTNVGNTVRDIVNVSTTEKTCCLVTIGNSENAEKEFNDFFNELFYQNKSNSIVAMYYIPSIFCNSNYFQRAEYNATSSGSVTSKFAYISKNNNTPTVWNNEITYRLSGNVVYPNGQQLKLNNNKSRIFPFSFVEISNNMGGKIQSKFELSNNVNQITCNYQYSPLNQASGYLYLTNYDGIGVNVENSLTSIANPEIPYIHYTYGAYVASNRNSLDNSLNYIKSDKELALFNNDIDTVQQQTRQVNTSLGSALGLNFGSYASNLTNFLSSEIDYKQRKNNIEYSAQKSIDSINAKLRDVKTMGNTASGVFSTNGCLMLNKCGFSKYYYFPQYEELKTIDNYFSKFGYKINDFKKPNLYSRKIFNYVKCSEVNIIANIPSDYINVLKAIFSQGVTLWHDLEKMYDFDFENNIIVNN